MVFLRGTWGVPLILYCILLGSIIPSLADSICHQAVIDMSGIKGVVKFEQATSSSNTTITVNLTGVTTNLTWQIHEFPVVYRGNPTFTCQAMYIGGVYDPSNKMSDSNYKSQCSSNAPKQCAVGDLTGKHGYIGTNTGSFVDPMLPLSGSNSVFTRSIVFYNGSSTPFLCGLIDSCHDVITAVATFRDAVTGITGTVRLQQVSPNMDTSVDINVFFFKNLTSNYDEYRMVLSKTKLPVEGIPSYTSDNCPTDKEQNPTPITVKIPVAINGPSTKRMLLNLPGFPLTGSETVIGSTLSLWKNDQVKICASICERLPLEAEVKFDVDGVTGSFNFKQQSELSPTEVDIDLQGLRKIANTYHVHEFRVETTAVNSHTNMKGSCKGHFVAGHWNPYDTKFLSPGIGTVDQYEIGDLSGKYGVIGDKDNLTLSVSDFNLPLFGENSIIFRSIVIHHSNGSRWVCANINPKTPSLQLRVKSVFAGTNINGVITVEQASFLKNTNCTCSHSQITTIFVQLEYANKSHPITKYHNWHVHEFPPTTDEAGVCLSAGGHYNPYSVSTSPKSLYDNECGRNNLLRCELGDTSNKVGKIDIGSPKKRFSESQNYFATLHSILGRSIVIHAENGGAARIACAPLIPDSYKFVEKKITFKTSGATADDFTEALSNALKVFTWQISNTIIEKHLEKCETATFTLVDNSTSDLGAAFDELEKDWPAAFETYRPVTLSICSPTSPTSEAAILRSAWFMVIVSVFAAHGRVS